MMDFATMPQIVLATTVLLAFALLVAPLARRSPATRHALLLWALIAALLIPIVGQAGSVLGLHWRVSEPALLTHIAVFRASTNRIVAPLAAPSPDSSKVPSWTTLLAFLWMAGSAFAAARLGAGLWRIKRMRDGSYHGDDPKLEQAVARLRALGNFSRIEIALSGEVPTPLALGTLRPLVLLPSCLTGQLDADQLVHVLLHECAHLQRRDPAIGLLQRAVAVVWWFHPLVHLANRQMVGLREEMCDDAVLRVARPSAYARTLLAVAQGQPLGRMNLLASALGNGSSGLETRIAALLNPARRQLAPLSVARRNGIALAFVVLGLSLGASVSVAQNNPLIFVAPDKPLSNAVDIRLGASHFAPGDWIEIEHVQGSSAIWTAGERYQVSGHYWLASYPQATLGAFVTTSGPEPDSNESAQTQIVKKGYGTFSLEFPLQNADGKPHISFYPSAGGEQFGGVYLN